MAHLDKQIRHLSYGIHNRLASLLDMNGPRNWKALISVMPAHSYSVEEVGQFERESMRYGGSPSTALLTDLGQKCKTVRQLISWLKKIGLDEALNILDYQEEVSITEQPRSQPVQAGMSVTLRCTATGCPTPVYQWVKDGMQLPDGIEEELTLNKVTMKDQGKYMCIVSNALSVEKSNTVELQVLPAPGMVNGACQGMSPQAKYPPSFVHHPQSAIIPVGHPFELVIETSEIADYQWYKDGFKLFGETNPILHFKVFCYQDEGNYSCRAENSAGDALSNVATLQSAFLAYDPLHDQGLVSRSADLNQKATDKVALIIGNRDYIHVPTTESPLVHSCSDAKMLACILRKPEMNFKVISLINLTKEEMLQAFSTFYSLLGEGVYGLVYFAGHGFEEGGQNYLVPIDASGDWVPQEAVCAQKVLEEMNSHKTQVNVFLLDICRKRPTTGVAYTLENYDFPYTAQVVLGFATCPQSEAYERRQDPNGMYMKHLLKHIMKDTKVEDILHRVAGDVEEEVMSNEWIERQRPQFHTTTTKSFCLRDPIISDEYSDERRKRWLDMHKLPQKRILEFESDIKVEFRFEHQNWLSNVIVLCLRVVDLGKATFCDAKLMLENLPLDVQKYHFHETTTNVLRQVYQPIARSMPSKSEGSEPCRVERISEIYNIQRLKRPLALTLKVEYILRGTQEQRTKCTVEVFACKEFGIATAFQN